MDKEKKEFQEGQTAEGLQAVRNQIQDARRKVYQSESHQRRLERDLQQTDQDITYIRGDIR